MPAHQLPAAPSPRRLARPAAAIAVALAAGLFACAALLLAVARPAWAAPAAVSRGYPDVAPCDTTLQACIDGSADGDSIVIVANTYITSFTLDKAVSLIGAPGGGVILQALTDQRVITVTGPAISNSVVISGLTFTGGNLPGATSCPQDCGGGLLLENSAQPLLVNLIITGNSAYDGGGLYADTGSLVLMTNSQVLINTSLNNGGGVFAQEAVTLTAVLFQMNQCADVFCQGGGLLTNGTLWMTDTQFISNTSVANGGGAFAQGAATLNGGLFQANQCTGDCLGGGLLALDALWMTGTQFVGNIASAEGGGADVGEATVLNGGLFQANHCIQAGCLAGGLHAGTTLALTGTQFISNTATGRGGGLRTSGAAVLNGGLFQANQCFEADCSGGGVFATGNVALTGTRFISNTAGGKGGGMNSQGGGHGPSSTTVVTLARAQFIGNSAQSAGGGLYLEHLGTSNVANSLFAANTALSGTALYLDIPGSAALLHNTIAAPAPVTMTFVYVVTGSVGITDTLFFNHATAIHRSGGSVREDYNLFTNALATTSGGVLSGGHSLIGVAGLADPAAGDYHLTAASDAIDAGLYAGIDVDFEGDPRPMGSGFDIGYDETGPVADVAISKTDGQATVQQGGILTYTIVVSNAGPADAAGVVVSDSLPAGLTGASWTCAAAAGSACPASGLGSLSAVVTVTAGSAVTFTLQATVNTNAPAPGASIANTAEVLLPDGLGDPTSADHSATDVTFILVDYRLYLPLVRRSP